jgi:hypothetical protein
VIDDVRDLDFYRRLWERIVPGEFAAAKLVQCVRRDGGVDTEGLSDSDLLALIEERYSGDWAEVAFTASEMLASYTVPGGIAAPEQVVAWVFAALALSDAIKNGAADWSVTFDTFLDGFFLIRKSLEFGEAQAIFERAFQAQQV